MSPDSRQSGSEAHFFASFGGKDASRCTQAILDCIYEAVCVIDAEGFVRFWNTSAETLYDVPRDAILGRHVLEFFPNALVDRVRRTRLAEKNIHHVPRQDSHIMSTAIPLVVNGVFAGAVSSDRDYAEVMRLSAQLKEAHSHVDQLKMELKKLSSHSSGLLGKSRRFLETMNRVAQIAPGETTVMLSGASGTGKELFARKIHELSGRKGPFVPVNCGAIPPELFESEFFGYSPGAFSGASRHGKPGFFEMADNGTLFLDEIGELPLLMQAKLLRVLQEREVMRVGGTSPQSMNVRIVSATNRNIQDMVAQGTFREDLYYRLHVVEIHIPALRERRDDIPLLLAYYVEKFSEARGRAPLEISPEAAKLLCRYDWPGNIRELMNVVEGIVATSSGPMLTVENIPEIIFGSATPAELDRLPLDLDREVRALESRYIRKALRESGGNKALAARMLRMPRATLYHKLAQYGLE